jgi:hypothetical protein
MKNTLVFFRWIKPLLGFVVVSMSIVACSVTGAKPTLQPGLVETTVALTLAAMPTLVSPTPPQATPAPPTLTALPPTNTSAPPTAAPTKANLPSGMRVNFATGATSGIVTGQIGPGQVKDYLVGAAAGQPMIVSVDSPDQAVSFSITGVNDGVVLLSPSEKATSWQTMLSKTQDYLVQVAGGSTTENFTLNIITPARINFDPGAISAQRSGSTPGGLNVSYVLRASAGQKMKLQLDAPGGNAVLGVYGYQDGQPYLRYVVEQTSFEMTLPATQDYIIQVIPRGGEVASYKLTVEVK